MRPPVPPSTVWTKTDLYRFGANGGADAARPNGGVVFDTSGALYGVAKEGGAIYKVSPPVPPSTTWTETVIYSFRGLSDGAEPVGELVFDASGALYGATRGGGISNGGTVFKLSPPSPPATTWTKTAIYSFRATNDGASPLGGVVFGPDGALYGATYSHRGGSYGNSGTVYRLKPPIPPATAWMKTELHRFTGDDGGGSVGSLVIDGEGAVFGVAYFGGSAVNGGVIYRLTPPTPPATGWTMDVLHRFNSPALDRNPSGLVFDTAGFPYGVTESGGALRPNGAIYRLAPPVPPSTSWTRGALYAFAGEADGARPLGPLTFGPRGALFGATWSGGAANGTIFRLGRW